MSSASLFFILQLGLFSRISSPQLPFGCSPKHQTGWKSLVQNYPCLATEFKSLSEPFDTHPTPQGENGPDPGTHQTKEQGCPAPNFGQPLPLPSLPSDPFVQNKLQRVHSTLAPLPFVSEQCTIDEIIQFPHTSSPSSDSQTPKPSQSLPATHPKKNPQIRQLKADPQLPTHAPRKRHCRPLQKDIFSLRAGY